MKNLTDLQKQCEDLLEEHKALAKAHETVLPAARGSARHDPDSDAREIHSVKLQIHREKLQQFKKALGEAPLPTSKPKE